MKNTLIPLVIILFLVNVAMQAQVSFTTYENNDVAVFVLQNKMVRQSVVIQDNRLLSDTLQSLDRWTVRFNRPANSLVTDADFELEIMWNRWYDRTPGTRNNADNPAYLTKKNFTFDHHSLSESVNGEKILDLYFKGIGNTIGLRLSYKLAPGEFYTRRKIVLKDPKLYGHYLEKVNVRKGWMAFAEAGAEGEQTITFSMEGFDYSDSFRVENNAGDAGAEVIKAGEFGQPFALKNSTGGAFGGIEYPTGVNHAAETSSGIIRMDSYQYVGKKIGETPVESSWMVMGITPEPYVKKWFFDYVKDIRVAPADPYTLYNSWYDLRSADYPKVPKDAVMNQKNVLRIWDEIRTNMIEKHGIHLNAFVLDDGWDVYESDWQLRKKQFPKGLKPIADTLAKSGTVLGIWFGPTGGYSFHKERVKWMYEHGYEVTGNVNDPGSGMLCLAGKKYSKLFLKRVTGFVKNDHVGYYKWDGIQFACSEPNHGHPVGIHSRRAVMESVIEKCEAVRKINPDIYLNITSGTWLSPWWVQYANQIWMDAADYAFADVPSISRRDNAMTYRDFALFDDFHIRNFWFPVSNLMTHGIIKGRLEHISKEEPIDKFTNNTVLYFARGVSMWELYISPDELTDPEWNALSQSLKWAKDRFDLLSTTFMVGDNPALGNTYGYVHFKGNKGIIAVRNPKIESDRLTVTLDPEFGLDEKAANLVVEQVYPKRYIYPQLYSAGGKITFELGGFETAVFDIYPLDETAPPLLAGAVFDLRTEGTTMTYTVIKGEQGIRFLNPEKIETLEQEGRKIGISDLHPDYQLDVMEPGYSTQFSSAEGKFTFTIDPSRTLSKRMEMVALLLKPDTVGGAFPEITIRQGNNELKTEKQTGKGSWQWISAVPEGSSKDLIKVEINKTGWKGQTQLWLNTAKKKHGYVLKVTTGEKLKEKVMPPLPFPANEFRYYQLLDEKRLD
ncbi:MAG: hypothetical protein GXO86_01275 [Chlorobi bacterium]|nr:hypothetical protein [Chlorobiota bacterium]